MAKKQAVLNPLSVAGAAPARAVKPAVSRTRTSKHSKAFSVAETAAPAPHDIFAGQETIENEIIAPPPVSIGNSVPANDAGETIARIAYGYWEARGYQGGDPLEDWVRAEEEYRGRQAV